MTGRLQAWIRNTRPRMCSKLDQGSRPPFLPLNEGETLARISHAIPPIINDEASGSHSQARCGSALLFE